MTKSIFRNACLAACVAALLSLYGCSKEPAAPAPPAPAAKVDPERCRKFAEAAVVGAHAWHVQLCRKEKDSGDLSRFSPQGKSDEEIDALVKRYTALTLSRPSDVLDWACGRESSFDPARAVEPLLASGLKVDPPLPAGVAVETFSKLGPNVPREKVLALANLMQVGFEVDRESRTFLRMCEIYNALGLLLGPSDFGVKDDDDAFLELGKSLAEQSCAGPYPTDARAWQIQCRKVQNTGMRLRGIMGPKQYADDVLARDEVKALIPKIRAAAPVRFLVIGHSLTMIETWTTHASFNHITGEAFTRYNPASRFKHFGGGSLKATAARNAFLRQGLDFKPTKVFLGVGCVNEDDWKAYLEMVKAFRQEGAEVLCFDRWMADSQPRSTDLSRQYDPLLKEAGLVTLEIGKVLDAQPDKTAWRGLDGHMKGPYHKAIAVELLKYLVGERKAELP